MPPPPFVTKPNFWLGMLMFVPFVIPTVMILGDFGVDDGRTVADGTIVTAEYAPNDFGKPFYDIDVQFETLDGALTTGAARKYGSAAVGESFQLQYLNDNPTDILKYDPMNTLLIALMFGTFVMIGLCLIVLNRPRPMPFDIGAQKTPDSWWQAVNNQRTGVDETLHLFAGDRSTLWIWHVGPRSIAGLVEWLRSGGAPAAATPAHWQFQVSAIHTVTLTPDKLSFLFTPSSGRRAKSFAVRSGGEQVIEYFAASTGWTVTRDTPTQTGRLRKLLRQEATSWALVTSAPAMAYAAS